MVCALCVCGGVCRFRFDGDRGETIVELPGVPESLQSLFDEKRMEMIERLADVDDEVGIATCNHAWHI
jgi:hypothetical protein